MSWGGRRTKARDTMTTLKALAALVFLASLASAHDHHHHHHDDDHEQPTKGGHACVHNEHIAPVLQKQSERYALNDGMDFLDVATGEIGFGGSSDDDDEELRKLRHRRRLQQTTPRPLEVHLEYQLGSLDQDKQDLLVSKLMPASQAVLRDYIAAKAPVEGRLLIARHCRSYWDAPPYLCYQISPVGACLDAAHNETYFGAYKECTSPQTESCTTNAAGDGVTDKDIILYVTALNSAMCGEMTVAYAGWCELDPYTKRPIAGNINFCPGRLDTSEAAFGELLDTAIHEIFHVLAFSDGLYQYFVSSETGQQLGLGNVISQTSTTKSFITPNVVNAARERFGCDAITEVRLENEGGSATAHSHWEELHYAGELMVGVQAGRSEVTNLTLALLQDTGWYHIDYAKSAFGRYGHREGCSFVNGECSALKTDFPKYYCSAAEKETSQCTADHMAFGFCHDSNLGDTCTTIKAYSNGHCWDASFNSESRQRFGENHGLGSRCFEAPADEVRVQEGNLIYTSTIAGAGCFQTQCQDSKLYIGIGGSYRECPAGQFVNFADIDSKYQSGRIGPCPSAEDVCPYWGCPNDCSGNGKCLDQVCSCYLGHSGSDCSQSISSDGTPSPSPEPSPGADNPAPAPTPSPEPTTPNPTPTPTPAPEPAPAPESEPETFSHSYRCLDGYLSKCSVYLSTDFAKYAESDVTGVANDKGLAQLSYQYSEAEGESYFANAYVFLSADGTNCVDSFTGLPLGYDLMSRRDAKMVSPLTTLAVTLTTTHGLDASQASERILRASNASVSNVFDYDPIEEAASSGGDRTGFGFASQLVSTVSVLGAYYAKEQGSDLKSTMETMMTEIANLMAVSSLVEWLLSAMSSPY